MIRLILRTVCWIDVRKGTLYKCVNNAIIHLTFMPWELALNQNLFLCLQTAKLSSGETKHLRSLIRASEVSLKYPLNVSLPLAIGL